MRKYRDGYDSCFKQHGNDYTIRNPQGLATLQAAEQEWNDFAVPFLAANGMGARPEWALEALPGLQRVSASHPLSTPQKRRPQLHLPTPPATLRVRAEVPVAPRLPALVTSVPRTRHLQRDFLIPPPSSPVLGGASAPPRLPAVGPSHSRIQKRKLSEIIEISDSEDEVVQPARKKNKSLGIIDLTEEPAAKLINLGVVDLTNDE